MASRNRAEVLGLPEGWKVYSPNPFGGLNQQDGRSFLADSELFWRENLIRIGNGNLRAMWDAGTSVYTASGKTIISFFFFSISGLHDRVAVFLSDGTADQVDLSTTPATITHISTTPGTFWQAGAPLPACSQSGSQYLLIANNFNINAYWIWDGSVLYHAGSLGPTVTVINSGMNYNGSQPTITLRTTGSGAGATFQSDIENGAVANVRVTNPGSGFAATDFISLVVQGGGSDTQAIASPTISANAGGIASVTVTAGGQGYSAASYATVTGGGGSGASLAIEAVNGTITQIVVINPGTGFTSAPTIGITDPAATPGTGFSAIANVSFGQVTAVTVLNAGTNYTTVPTVAIRGDGSGAVGVAAINSTGAVTSVHMINPGFGYTKAVIDLIGGNNAANLSAQLMPFGVSGSTIETYQSRVWLGFPNANALTDNGGTMLLSAPASLTDFATSDGGLIFVNNDRFLRTRFTALRQTNGYLYPFGDSSVSVISNVQTGGNPTTTTFNFQNTDPQIGTSWRDSLQDYGRTILFGNVLGVYGLYGGSVTKISAKIDKLFTTAPANGVVPSGATANVYSQRLYLMLRTITDPFTKQPRTVMLGWDEKEWMIVSQTPNLTYIGTREVDSDITAWGTDGINLYPLLATPSSGLIKTLFSKQYGAQDLYVTKQALAFYLMTLDQSSNQSGVSFIANVNNTGIGFVLTPAPAFPAAMVNGSETAIFYTKTPDIYGQLLSFNLTSMSQDFEIENAILAYMDMGSLY